MKLVLAIYGDKPYQGHRLIRVYPTKVEHFKLITDSESNDPMFDVWSSVKVEPAFSDILLPAVSFLKYKALFDSKDIKFEIINNNIQNEIDHQEKLMNLTRKGSSIIFKYARYEQMMNFIDGIAAANPEIASTYSAGKTHEGRDLKVIVLNPVKTSTRSLWLDCGIHAREWVSPATCIFTISILLNEFKNNDPETVAIFNKYQIHILSLVNPDGYEYTHTYFRLWRKNRKPNIGSSCTGTDLNRNWGFHWMSGGADDSPCSDIYAGPSKNSELEVQGIQNALKQRPGNWDAYINVHSYGNYWLLPWGFESINTNKPIDYDEMLAKANVGTAAIKAVNGETFTPGASADLLYVNSGSGKDWAYGAMNIKYSYVLELRPGKDSPDFRYGFILPENRMPMVATETYAGIKAFYHSLL